MKKQYRVEAGAGDYLVTQLPLPRTIPFIHHLLFPMLAVLLVAQSAAAEGAPDSLGRSNGVFHVTVEGTGRVTYWGNEFPSLPPFAPGSAKQPNLNSLADTWKKYYAGYLNGDQDVLKTYSASRVAPTVPSRAAGEKAELDIITVSQRGGTVRVIVHWTIHHSENNTTEFYDCHVWSETGYGQWRVRSMLEED